MVPTEKLFVRRNYWSAYCECIAGSRCGEVGNFYDNTKVFIRRIALLVSVLAEHCSEYFGHQLGLYPIVPSELMCSVARAKPENFSRFQSSTNANDSFALSNTISMCDWSPTTMQTDKAFH